ncbi:MAG: hypothetical protein V3V97_08145 [Hyphomicrobiaceae bacterium]
MYARVTNTKCDPARLDEMVALIDEIKPRAKSLPGLVDAYSVWRANGECVVMAIYESQSAAEAAAPQIQAIWGELADLLVAPPSAETYDQVEHMTG